MRAGAESRAAVNAVIVDRPGGGDVEIRYEPVPMPRPGEGEVLVEPRFIGICGSDLELVAGHSDDDFPIEYPATFRGDFLGIVEQIVRSLQNTDAPIRVKVYDANRVLRVVHATQ